jgi:hypothetical protein
MKMERQYLTAVQIVNGIITLIDNDGRIARYRQRGIGQFTDDEKMLLVNRGLLDRQFMEFNELPSNISIQYECPDIQGKAQAKFPSRSKVMKLLDERL